MVILGQSRGNLGGNRGSNLGGILRCFQGNLRSILGKYQGNLGLISGKSLGYLRVISGSQGEFRDILRVMSICGSTWINLGQLKSTWVN